MAETVGQHSVAAFTSPVNGTSPIDANTVKGNDNTIRSAYVDHDADPGIHVQSSTLASRPVANSAGRKWMTQDSGVIRLFYDDGTSWYEVDYLRTTGGTISGNLSITGTLAVTGVATFTAQPILSSLTASRAVFTDGSKGLVSNAITGTGDVVMSASPTLTGTITAASATLSGTLGVSGLLTFASLKGTGATTVTNILDEDNMASDSATALATQQSIKAYVDAQVGASDALSEVLAIGNTTGANDIIVSAGQKIRTPAVAAQDGSSAITIANTTGALTLATALADSNLATISTAGKVSNSATTATSANTASAIVARDASGNFTAGTITAALTGNASTATTLQTARNINGVSFNGSADITVTAAAGTLTGTTLASNVTASSLTSVGTLANLTVTNPITGSVTGSSGSTTGNAATATALQTARNINGVSFNGTADITVTAAAGTLTGTTLASGVTASSLTSVGTLTSLAVSGAITGATSTNTINGLVINSGGLGGATGIKFGIGAAFSSGQAEAYTTSTTPMGIGTVGAQPLRFYTNSALVAAFDSSGNLAVDTNTLYVDAANNRVGVGTATPGAGYRLHIVDSGNTVGTNTPLFLSSANGVATTSYGWDNLTSSYDYTIKVNGSTTALTISNTGNLAVDTNTLYVDAANNRVGVGTASPGFRSTIQHNFPATFTNAAGDYAFMVQDDAPENWLGVAGQTTTDKWVGLITNGSPAPSLVFGTGGSERMRIDTSGNLGLGAGNIAGWDTYTSLELPSSGYVSSGVNWMEVMYNTYYASGAYRYKANGAASHYLQQNGAHSWHTAASGTAGNAITFTQAMTLNASGNLGVGTTSPGYRLDVSGDIRAVTTGTTRYIIAGSDTQGAVFQQRAQASWGDAFQVYRAGNLKWALQEGSDAFIVSVNSAERARITSGGYFKASDAGTYVNSTGTFHEFRNTANSEGLQVSATNASYTNNVFQARASRDTSNNTFYYISCFNDGASNYRFRVADSGNATNTNGSYGTISDIKHKQDVVDAPSQWDDIKAIRFRKFRMKSDVEANPDAPYMLGVVAQELEQVSPGLIEEHLDFEEQEVTDEDGNVTTEKVQVGTTKSVKSSILLMKAAVALQEAMARIESLEARLAALES